VGVIALVVDVFALGVVISCFMQEKNETEGESIQKEAECESVQEETEQEEIKSQEEMEENSEENND
jgi:hypothetical protein